MQPEPNSFVVPGKAIFSLAFVVLGQGSIGLNSLCKATVICVAVAHDGRRECFCESDPVPGTSGHGWLGLPPQKGRSH